MVINIEQLKKTIAGQIAQKLDAQDGKIDGKIKASIWNDFAKSVGGKEIKNEISIENAIGSITLYAQREAAKSVEGQSATQVAKNWFDNLFKPNEQPTEVVENSPAEITTGSQISKTENDGAEIHFADENDYKTAQGSGDSQSSTAGQTSKGVEIVTDELYPNIDKIHFADEDDDKFQKPTSGDIQKSKDKPLDKTKADNSGTTPPKPTTDEVNKEHTYLMTAMKTLQAGAKKEDFAKAYAQATGATEGSQEWNDAIAKANKEFDKIDSKQKDGVLSEDEFDQIKIFVEQHKDSSEFKPTIEEMTGNEYLDAWKLTTKKNPGDSSIGRGIEERHNLKPVDTMTEDEIIAEIKQFKPDFNSQGISLNGLRKQLTEMRKEINTNDKNSDVVDMHIGTFNQGNLGSCTFLSQLSNMTDEKMQKMIKVKTDDNGKKYYEVTFPMDEGSGKTVKITEDELKSRELHVKDGDKEQTVTAFSTGDADVTLMEMAFIRRFGVDGFVEGVNSKNAQNIFSYPDEIQSQTGYGEVTEEKLKSNPSHANTGLKDTFKHDEASYKEVFQSETGITAHWTMSRTNRNEAMSQLQRAGIDTTGLEKLSDGEFANEVEKYVGYKGFSFMMELTLSNGVKVIENHALAVKSYDPQTKTVTLSNPHANNEDVQIPLDIAQKFFNISF